jgi:hypothetical protein
LNARKSNGLERRYLLATLASLAGSAVYPTQAPAKTKVGVKGAPVGDISGTWTLGTYTEFRRPKELQSLVLTPAQAEAYEAPRRALGGMKAAKAGELGQAESEFNERGNGLARVNGQIRSSWIIDPEDGQIPYTAAAKARLGLDKDPPVERFDNPEDLNGSTRCLSNSAAGAPMMGAPDANLFEIIQTPGYVAILTEKYHDVRIVRLDRASRPNLNAQAWMGDSVGRWEGETLVVETQGFRRGVTGRGSGLYLTEYSRVFEQFTHIGLTTLLYSFTVEDPSLFTQAWRGEMAMDKARGRIFEYACHEGNYSLRSILAGARRAEATAKPK